MRLRLRFLWITKSRSATKSHLDDSNGREEYLFHLDMIVEHEYALKLVSIFCSLA